jgi:hypothetical protein
VRSRCSCWSLRPPSGQETAPRPTGPRGGGLLPELAGPSRGSAGRDAARGPGCAGRLRAAGCVFRARRFRRSAPRWRRFRPGGRGASPCSSTRCVRAPPGAWSLGAWAAPSRVSITGIPWPAGARLGWIPRSRASHEGMTTTRRIGRSSAGRCGSWLDRASGSFLTSVPVSRRSASNFGRDVSHVPAGALNSQEGRSVAPPRMSDPRAVITVAARKGGPRCRPLHIIRASAPPGSTRFSRRRCSAPMNPVPGRSSRRLPRPWAHSVTWAARRGWRRPMASILRPPSRGCAGRAGWWQVRSAVQRQIRPAPVSRVGTPGHALPRVWLRTT